MKAINFKISLSFFVLVAFFLSCEDVVQVKLSDKDIGLYAVEAKITTESNPYVFLFKSQLVSSNDDYSSVRGAKVEINDNATPQKTITLYESKERQGLYLPNKGESFFGEQGLEYTLTITVNDLVMQATELLAPVEPIDSIQIRPSGRGDNLFLGIFTYGNEPAGLGNYYKWDIYVNNNPLFSSNNLVVGADDLLDGSYIQGLEILTDFHDPNKPEERAFKLGDTIQVKQTSISKFAYQYYSQMLSQGQTGGLFSVPPANIKSNISSNDGRAVLGVFTASDVSTSNTIVIDEKIEGGLKEI